MKKWIIALTLILALLCATAAAEEAGGMPVTLTVGDTVLQAYLNDTSCARELIARLPATVSLYNSVHDYCGGISPALTHDEADVQYGWRDGDLAFWTAGNDFVIFHDDEESSQGTGNLVILGHVTSDIEAVRALPDFIDVTIALAQEEPAEAELKMKITAGDRVLTATLIDNATTRALMEQIHDAADDGSVRPGDVLPLCGGAARRRGRL